MNEGGRRARETPPSSAATESDLSAPAPFLTPSESETPPDLPGIILSPAPLSRSPYTAVYRGWDRVHRIDVFVKTLRATDDPVARERFSREAAVMGRLRHPNIAILYRFYDGDPAALVMEYVPGRTLTALVTDDGWLSPARAAGIIEGIAAALDLAHAQGIIHRDIKPANILIPKRGPVRLTDFGVAHIEDDAPLTVMGDILGTIEYASPEQVHGNEAPDARSDVYSLAAVAYFALTGTPPFRAADSSTQALLSVMHRQVFADPPPLRFHREEISPEVENAVLRGLAKAPDARYQSAGQLAAALRSAVEFGAGAPEQRAITQSSRRTGALAGALAGGTLLVLAAMGLPKVGYFAPHTPRPQNEVWHFPSPASSVPQRHLIPPAQAHVAPVPAWPKLVATAKSASGTPPRPPTPILGSQKRTAENNGVRGGVPGGVVPKKTPLKKTLMAQRLPITTSQAISDLLFSLSPAKSAPKPKPIASQGKAWLYVYANQNTALLGRTPRLANIRAQAVYVDGSASPSLTAGHWAALPSGTHFVSFFPDVKSGFSPHAGVRVALTPGAHIARQILLPRMTNFSSPASVAPRVAAVAPHVAVKEVGWFSVSGWIAAGSPDQKPELIRSPVAWVKVDDQPVATLALGQWTELAAGRHVVTFQPAPGLGAGPKTWTIDLLPKAHLQQQIPLPAAPLPVIPLHLRNP